MNNKIAFSNVAESWEYVRIDYPLNKTGYDRIYLEFEVVSRSLSEFKIRCGFSNHIIRNIQYMTSTRFNDWFVEFSNPAVGDVIGLYWDNSSKSCCAHLNGVWSGNPSTFVGAPVQNYDVSVFPNVFPLLGLWSDTSASGNRVTVRANNASIFKFKPTDTHTQGFPGMFTSFIQVPWRFNYSSDSSLYSTVGDTLMADSIRYNGSNSYKYVYKDNFLITSDVFQMSYKLPKNSTNSTGWPSAYIGWYQSTDNGEHWFYVYNSYVYWPDGSNTFIGYEGYYSIGFIFGALTFNRVSGVATLQIPNTYSGGSTLFTKTVGSTYFTKNYPFSVELGTYVSGLYECNFSSVHNYTEIPNQILDAQPLFMSEVD